MVRARVLYAAAADGRWTDGNTHRRLLTRGIIAFGGGTLCQSSVLRQVNVAVHAVILSIDGVSAELL